MFPLLLLAAGELDVEVVELLSITMATRNSSRWVALMRIFSFSGSVGCPAADEELSLGGSGLRPGGSARSRRKTVPAVGCLSVLSRRLSGERSTCSRVQNPRSFLDSNWRATARNPCEPAAATLSVQRGRIECRPLRGDARRNESSRGKRRELLCSATAPTNRHGGFKNLPLRFPGNTFCRGDVAISAQKPTGPRPAVRRVVISKKRVGPAPRQLPDENPAGVPSRTSTGCPVGQVRVNGGRVKPMRRLTEGDGNPRPARSRGGPGRAGRPPDAVLDRLAPR